MNTNATGIAKVVPDPLDADQFAVIALEDGIAVSEQLFCTIPTSVSAVTSTNTLYPNIAIVSESVFDADLASR